MFFPLTGTPYAGGTGASGVVAPATRWILAEGAAGVFETFILVVNPARRRATSPSRYLRGDGTVVTESTHDRARHGAKRCGQASRSRARRAGLLHGRRERRQPVVAERAMYFDNFRSGHDALGVTERPHAAGTSPKASPAATRTIAFETFLLIGNDNDTAGDRHGDVLPRHRRAA